MSKSYSFYATYALLLAFGLFAGQVVSQEKVTIDRDDLGITIPNPFGSVPLLETNERNDNRYIGMHIPLLLDLKWEHRGGLTNFWFNLNMMSGLFGVEYNKAPGADGNNYGPVKISILWMELYNNGQAPISY